MLPAIRARATKWQMLAYTLLLLPLVPMPYRRVRQLGLYGSAAGILSGVFILSALRVLTDETDRSAAHVRVFHFLSFCVIRPIGCG